MTDSADAERKIHRTLAAYCQLVDDGEFGRLAEQFAPDGCFSYAGEDITGRDALERWFAKMQPPRRRGKHLTMNAIADVAGDRADVLSDYLFLRVIDGQVQIDTAGRYRDVFVRTGDEWLILRREVEPMASSSEQASGRA